MGGGNFRGGINLGPVFCGSDVGSVAKHVPVNTTPPHSLSFAAGQRGIMTTIFIGESIEIPYYYPELELDHGKELRFNIVRSPDIRQQQLNKILQAHMNRSEPSTCKSI